MLTGYSVKHSGIKNTTITYHAGEMNTVSISSMHHFLQPTASNIQHFTQLTWSNWGSSPLCSDFVNGFSWKTEKKSFYNTCRFYYVAKFSKAHNSVLSSVGKACGVFLKQRLITAQLMREPSISLTPGRSRQGQILEMGHSWQLPLLQSSIIWDKGLRGGGVGLNTVFFYKNSLVDGY